MRQFPFRSPIPSESAPIAHQGAALAADLPALMMAARRVAADVMPGIHGRRQTGQGEAFWQFRPYVAGDSLRQIDWRQSARGDQVFVRQQEWEAAQTLRIWVGQDAAMTQAHRFDRCAVLALALALLLERNQEKIMPLAPDLCPMRGREGTAALGNWLATRARAAKTSSSDGPDLPPEIAIPAHGRMLFLTDGWQPIETWARIIGYYQRRQQIGHLVQVTSPLEDDFALHGHVRLGGLFGEAPEAVPDAGAVRADCQHRLRAHRDHLAALCRKAGWFYLHHRLDHAPGLCLLALCQQLQQVT